jgi:hypothetical protein
VRRSARPVTEAARLLTSHFPHAKPRDLEATLRAALLHVLLTRRQDEATRRELAAAQKSVARALQYTRRPAVRAHLRRQGYQTFMLTPDAHRARRRGEPARIDLERLHDALGASTGKAEPEWHTPAFYLLGEYREVTGEGAFWKSRGRFSPATHFVHDALFYCGFQVSLSTLARARHPK